jgi:hypothetical protein
LYAALQPLRVPDGEVMFLNSGGLKVFDSIGFVVLIVFVAVLLTSVSLSAPAEHRYRAEEYSSVHAPMTPSAQRFDRSARPQLPRD